MSDETVPPPPPRSGSGDRPRRRRTALVTSRWAASAAVIAAMTVGAPDASAESSGSSFGDPYLGDVTSQVAPDDAPPEPSR